MPISQLSSPNESYPLDDIQTYLKCISDSEIQRKFFEEASRVKDRFKILMLN